jgi:4-amino-4-deoxy-L-arabinose transferase-like glycosyltransferase
VKYFEKPPLVYWLSALTMRQFGVSEFTGRIWNALFAVLGLLLTYSAGRLIYGRAAGIWAAVVLGTTLLYYVMSQIVLLDMAVSVTMSGALLAFLWQCVNRGGGGDLGGSWPFTGSWPWRLYRKGSSASCCREL